jgi:hypothetical protein
MSSPAKSLPATKPAWVSVVLALVAASLSLGCTAIYPELGTKISAVAPGMALVPAAPEGRRYVAVVGASLPPTMRDGRPWGGVEGGKPTAYLVVRVNDRLLFKTNPDPDTLTPTWPDSPRGNQLLEVGDTLEFQVWDVKALADRPIGVSKVRLSPELLSLGQVRTELEGGGEVTLSIEPAKAVWGAGIWFELRNDGAVVTRLLDESPASRAGIRRGDRILSIDGRPTASLSPSETRSLLAAIPAKGRVLVLAHEGGGTLDATLVEGPIYPLQSDRRLLPVEPK